MKHRTRILLSLGLASGLLALGAPAMAQRGAAPSGGRGSAPASRPSMGQSRGAAPAPSRSAPQVGGARSSPAPSSGRASSPSGPVVSPGRATSPAPIGSSGRAISPSPSAGRVISPSTGASGRAISPSPSSSGRLSSPSSAASSTSAGSRGAPSTTSVRGPQPSTTDYGGSRAGEIDARLRDSASGASRQPSPLEPGSRDGGLRSRPSTSPSRSPELPSLDDLGRADSTRPSGRTSFPEMYKPSPRTLSGARIDAGDRASAGTRIRPSERAEPSTLADRYARDTAAGRSAGAPTPERGAADQAGRSLPSQDPRARGSGLSGARTEGAARARGDSARPARGSDLGSARATPERSRGPGRAGAERSRPTTAPEQRGAWKDAQRNYSEARKQDPSIGRKLEDAARGATVASDVALRVGLGVTIGVPLGSGSAAITVGGWTGDVAAGGYYGSDCSAAAWWYTCGWYPTFCASWIGGGWWWSWSWGWGACYYPYYSYYPYYYPYYAYGWSPYAWGYPYYGYRSWYPAYYAYSPPAVYQTVYYGDTYYGAQEGAGASLPQVEEQQGAQPQRAAGVAPQVAAPPAQESASTAGRATAEYLNLGDRSFTAGEYGRAVRYYAKAVEYSPNDGVLYLVLADALFATGDYHYAAYALRRALELEPGLASAVIDKRKFYGQPKDFDHQLELLERYLQDHFLDEDARLVLAANYLFGGSPEKCVALLEQPTSRDVLADASGRLVHEAAKAMLQGRR